MSHLDFFSSLITAHSPTLLAMFAGAAFLAGLARGFSGFGAALIFIPLASAIVGPRVASAVLLVVDAVLPFEALRSELVARLALASGRRERVPRKHLVPPM